MKCPKCKQQPLNIAVMVAVIVCIFFLMFRQGGDNTAIECDDTVATNHRQVQEYVDLGLPSGTLWKDKNEDGEFYTYDEAVSQFGSHLPTKEQMEELINKCDMTWNGDGNRFTGPNGNSIVLPASGGFRNCNGSINFKGSYGYYWSSTSNGLDNAWYLILSGGVYMNSLSRCCGLSVRLVQVK